MRQAAGRHRQEGAVIITVALMMFFLLGFIGIALDLGRMFVVKTELQTAMDSCALAAAQELDLQPTAMDRARNAGTAAGNLNAVNFQSATWSDKGQLVNADITFKDAAYGPTTDPAVAQYAQCQHVQAGVQMWLMQAFAAVFGNPADYPNARDVGAIAVATRAHGQTTCPIPTTLKPKYCAPSPCPGPGCPCPGPGCVACTGPDYGFTPGEWITVISEQGAVPGGYIGWANLDGTTNANELRDELNGGNCGIGIDDELGTPGAKAAVSEEWNYRFGIYKKLPDFETDPSFMRPDFSGYAYNNATWPGESNAWSDFVSKRATHEKCASDIESCMGSTGATVKNPFKDLANSGSGASSHGEWGTNRRVVTVPVTNDSNKVIDFACMLILAPLPIPMTDTKLEYLGNASLPTSPCSFSGMPGGVAGPLVPALVQ